MTKRYIIFYTILCVVIITGRYAYCDSDSLKSLPYVAWSKVDRGIEKSGVTVYDRQKAFKGINIYSSRTRRMAQLLDMSGNTLHTWQSDEIPPNEWHHAQLCPNGDMLVFYEYGYLMRIGWDSNRKWVLEDRFHHEITVADNGDIYTFVRKMEEVPYKGTDIPIQNEYITVLTSEGKIKDRISVYGLFNNKLKLENFKKIVDTLDAPEKPEGVKKQDIFSQTNAFDVFHANTISIIGRDIPGLCSAGSLLICLRNLNIIAIVQDKRLVWGWGEGILDMPHHPTMLSNGNILVFDNGYDRGYSRIIEINPVTKQIEWEYNPGSKEKFFSGLRGACQRLPNGNTLISESDRGRVFEVTASGEVVWEYYNPVTRTNTNEREVIYRLLRIVNPEDYPCLDKLGG